MYLDKKTFIEFKLWAGKKFSLEKNKKERGYANLHSY